MAEIDLVAIAARAAEWGFSIHDGRALLTALRERDAEIAGLREALEDSRRNADQRLHNLRERHAQEHAYLKAHSEALIKASADILASRPVAFQKIGLDSSNE